MGNRNNDIAICGWYVTARTGSGVRQLHLFLYAWRLSLFKCHFKGTEYGTGWLPLGGYVKMARIFSDYVHRRDTRQAHETGVGFMLMMGILAFGFYNDVRSLT